jgi:hypothetical protein
MVSPGQVMGVELGAAVGFGVRAGVGVLVAVGIVIPEGVTASRLQPVEIMMTPKIEKTRLNENDFNRISNTPMSYCESGFSR